MRKLRIISAVVGLLAFNPTCVYSQDCLDNLDGASRAYYNGQFNEVISLLGSCDYASTDKVAKQEVFELLIKSYLLLDNTSSASEHMNNLLKTNPLYKPRPNDILLFRELFDSFRIVNSWNMGLTAGINLPDFVVLKYQSIGSVVREPVSYQNRTGVNLGIISERRIIENLYANLGVTYSRLSYSYSEIILEYQQLDVDEDLNYLMLPLTLRYQVPIGGIMPFINAGLNTQFLLKSRLALDLRAIPTEVPVPYVGIPYKTDDYDASFQRTPITFSYILGGGIRKTIGSFQIELALNYEYGLNNLVETKKRNTEADLIDTYFYIPDDIKVNNLRLSFGVYKSILIPKKR